MRSSGYSTPRAIELTGGRSDWILLLQLDSDEETGMQWGDGGMLYISGLEKPTLNVKIFRLLG